jgi:hypothetical protein
MMELTDEVAEKLYSDFRHHTMVPLNRFKQNLKLCLDMKNISGDVVECGTWRGGMLAGIRRVMGGGRSYWAFDSFEGLPPARAIDGKQAIDYQKNVDSPRYYNNCSAEREWVESLFSDDTTILKVVQGWFSDTMMIEENLPKEISILRLDGDWYESTMTSLKALFPRVVHQGLVIIDDYVDWVGSKRAVHTYFNLMDIEIEIKEKNGVHFFYKPQVEIE